MGDDRTNSTHVVIVGSSSGGIDALSKLVETLSEEFPAPIIIAQHLDHARPSTLDAILSKHTTLPVQAIEHHVELDAGTIYVVPANRRVDFDGREVQVIEDGEGRPRPSIDRLLTSAADAYGAKLIAVILTGAGPDGTAGARAVKSADGTVVIQNPMTAAYPSMPRSLAPTSIDFVAELDEIVPLLKQLIADPKSVVPGSPTDGSSLESFLEHIQGECQIDFSQYKTSTILRRLQRRMVATGTHSLQEYFDYLQANPQEYAHLVNNFLIKVTEFFRDSELFDELRSQVLPRLIEDGRTRGNELRLWSAGCATGEEAYSLAILVAEALGDERERFNVRIFATDVDDTAVGFARRGIYPAAALSELPAELVDRYFEDLGGEYEISKPVRGMMIFGQHDLGQRSPFPRIDLILCRNVLIYFTSELQRRALQLFAFSLRSGGYLALGKSESPGPLADYFKAENQRLRIYRRDGESLALPRISSDTIIPSVPRRVELPRAHQYDNVELHRMRREAHQSRISIEKTENLLFNMHVGVVTVDQNCDIRMINHMARRLLGIHGSVIGEDLLHLIQTLPLEPVRNGIDQAFRTSGQVTVEGEWKVEIAGRGEVYLEITCYSHDLDHDGAESNAVVVTLNDVTARVLERRRLAEEHEQSTEENQQLRDRVSQLLRNNEQLLTANRELASSNEELRSTNDQLLVANEESQAASEEIETLNEELQATNEELETLNEELQATVEELNATNEDMHARTIELQDMTVSLEEQRSASDAERAQLEAILVSMGDAVVVVDSQGTITLMNDACKEMFGEDLSKLEPETEHGEPLSEEQSPLQLARSGETFTMPFTTVGADGNRCWFEANGRPIRDDLGSSGTVVVIRDITDRSLRRLQEEFLAVASHELRSPLTALRGYLEMLQYHLPDEDERSNRYVSIALTMVHRLVDLVSDLLDVGRLQSGKFSLSSEPMDLRALVDQTVELAQTTTSDHTIVADLPPEPINLDADPMRIQQVLLNLLSNAIDYSPGKDRIDLRLRRDRDHAEIAIQDYGIGIDPEGVPQLFSRFYQIDSGSNTPQRGLGLGLYISREIVVAHGGEISVESTPGEGTTFTVRLPLASAWS